MLTKHSTPSLNDFDPRHIPYQIQVLNDILANFDYSDSKHEILLSGAAGSAKSILMAHIVVTHCLRHRYARACIARRTMPDLKDTLFQTILEHIGDDLIEGKDYWVNQTKASIMFKNRSEIISRSWADRKSKKGRSLQLSLLAVEELTENDDTDKAAIEELNIRVGRLTHVPEKIFIAATNPDGPEHWVYDYFIKQKSPTRHVYYSITSDNPFLPQWYRNQLLKDLDPRTAQRMVYGQWVSINTEYVYHQYDAKIHEVDEDYIISNNHPIEFSFDFNIGAGKPMSVIFYQVIGDTFHFFDEVVIQGARTENALEDAANRGLLEHPTVYLCHGDASGTHKDTRNKLSDYDIIDSFMRNFRNRKGSNLSYRREVPVFNPKIRERHNTVNAYLMNNFGESRIRLYPKCKVGREGLRLTKLREGADYIEDDSKYYQHIATAIGYGICWHDTMKRRKPSTVEEL